MTFRGFIFMIRPVNGAKKKPKNCVRPNISEYVTTTGKVNIKIKNQECLHWREEYTPNTRKNTQVVTNCSRLVAMLFQHLSTGCVRTACSQLVDKLQTAC